MPTSAQTAPPLTRDEALAAVRAGATLVAGSDRLARVLREAYNAKRQAAGESAWTSPRIHSWGVWIDRLWNELAYRSPAPLPTRLSADQERLLWEQAIALDPSQSPLLAIDATAEAARQAAKIAIEWRIRLGAQEAGDSEEVRSFLRWRREVEARLEAGGFTSDARVADVVIERIREIGGEVLLMAGFDVLTPQQQELLDAFRAADGAVREVAPQPNGDSRRRLVNLAGRRDELRAAAHWAKALADSGDAGRIRVVVPGLSERRQEVERAFLEAFDPSALLLGGGSSPGFVLSAGIPLARHPLVHSALLALELVPGGTDTATFGAWLRSDAVAGGAAERNARGLLDRELRSKGAPTVQPVRLGKLLDNLPQLKAALRKWSRQYQRNKPRQSPAEWSARFAHLLEALGWPGEEAETPEGARALLAWNDLLGAFARLSVTAGEWSFTTARRELARMAAAATFRPAAEEAQVEVLSLAESQGVEAERLWVVGLDDETWPDEPRPNPFLPIGLQRQLGIPHASAAEELRYAQIQTQRLLAAAPDVVISYARSVEDRELGPSPLVAELPEAKLEELVEMPPGVIQSIYAEKKLEQVLDAGLPLQEGEEARGGSKIFELQAHCPFRAFAELRLGAKALEETSEGLSYGDRGNLAHFAMEALWRDLEGSDDLRERGEEGRRRAISDAVTQAFEKLAERRRAPMPPGLEAVERARLEELLAGWLEIERTGRREPFRVEAVEQKREIKLGGVTANVRVDRIDKLENGQRVILDYKTGAIVDHKEWDHERSIQPQLPLYAVEHADSLAAVLFARLRVTEMAFLGAVAPGVSIEGADANRAEEFEERVKQWRANLEAVAADFLAGKAEIDPRDGKCGYCKLAALCRKDDVHAAG